VSNERASSRVTVEYGDSLLASITAQQKAEGYVSLSEFLRQIVLQYLNEIEMKKRSMNNAGS
jgi:metal-responsive CopG/Arc/MetJ family transcriptional regulator